MVNVDVCNSTRKSAHDEVLNYKSSLRKKLGLGHQCKPASELDGRKESGQVLTTMYLQSARVEDAISTSMIDESLNENLLWHGTDIAAANRIIKNDFRLSEGAAKHGKRFGQGIYLAEDLSKSLMYAPEDQGFRYVLLCRAACGEFYYTESDWD
eukprot:gnl/MRDRNA2_/MRDRNA2_60790_c0_seq1.p1 gnl/MRDRNA2_/MRDRNA2_60790_c0~~gnl/MRDRNA2_/MRDRNA2_60790_c0_seq1.p1  ORF type:complete len:154 (+),score=23.68 gnl/MRDRNA2_/MRDRNA2_60790_c0_seq1:28-489(+)